MKKIDYIELGGTLFVKATHKDLLSIVEVKKYPTLKSVVINTEDGLDEVEVDEAILKIKELLLCFEKKSILVFIRPRNIKVLKELLSLKNINKIDGFILPKFSLSNAHKYLELVDKSFMIMPSIEGEELFSYEKLCELRAVLLAYQEQIITIRFGLEDMLKQLKMRRECQDSIFDFSVTSHVLGSFISVFKPFGFNISGGVYPCFKDVDGFRKDIKRDLKEGLFSKTIIHPNQIELSNHLYRVTKEEFDEAMEICESSFCVFSQNNKMAEVTTMLPHAKEIIKRAEVYGVF